jgi:alpha-tubulin suppressor-like RCC1 family protein
MLLVRILRLLLTATLILIANPSVTTTQASEVSGHFYQRPTFVHLSVGQNSACAVSNLGQVWCWGSNSKYQVASRVSTSEATPFKIIGISNATQVAVGREHACALLKVKRVVCWGSNEYGQLGTGFEPSTLQVSPFPEFVNGVIDVKSIYAGDDHNCALTEMGNLFCWGLNSRGQTGHLSSDESKQIIGRTFVSQAEPVNISPVIDVALGTTHSCVVTIKELVWCWGNNIYGQLAQGWGVDRSHIPLLVGSLLEIKNIDASMNTTCAIDSKQRMQCWGAGESGQLGSLDTSDLSVPLNTSSTLSKYSVFDFSVGNKSTCAKLDNSAVYCWGSTTFGQVGSGNTSSVQLSPFSTIQYPLFNATQISSGGDFSCVLTGNVWCWGKNNLGQLGQMTTSTFSTYAQINNARWDLAPNSITHTVKDNIVSLSWPQIGSSQRYARVESSNGNLLCQTNIALTCDFIVDKLGPLGTVLILQVLDVNGGNQSARAEYSLEIKSVVSAADAKIARDSELAEKSKFEALLEAERTRKLDILIAQLKIAQTNLAAAEARMEKLNDGLNEALDSYAASKDRSRLATDLLNSVLNEYANTNLILQGIMKKLAKN